MKALPTSINNLFALPFSDSINSLSLAAGSAESFTIPSGANYVAFSATADFYALANGTAAVPADVTNGSASELNPTIRALNGTSAISVISSAACVVTAAFYG